MRVTIIGAGYVGLTTAITLAYTGHDVCCFDVDAAKIDKLRQGQIPIHEPHAEDMLCLANGRLRFDSDAAVSLSGAEVIFVAVNTPSGADGRASLQFVRAAAESIGKYISGDFVVVVNKSTVPLGSASLVEDVIRHSFAKFRGGKLNGQVGVVSNPEFLREGSAIYDSLYPNRIVIGANDERSLDVMRSLYRPRAIA